MARPTPIPERNWVNIQWLARLRWAQIAGQATTVLVAQFLLSGQLPIAWLLGVISLGLLSNLAIEMYFFGDRRRAIITPRPVREWHIALLMTVDIGILTGLLYLTGGPENPFAFLYLVQIALATVLVGGRWTWILVGLSFVGFGILLLTHEPLTIPKDSHAYGEWAALGVASAFVVHFLQRITAALAQRERELTEARGLADRQQRLASLATMAAGAAHELSTPLGTVALAAKELERALTNKHADVELAADARLIREQVGRCRGILDQMAQGAGTVGESVALATVDELIDETLVGIREQPRVLREIPEEIARASLRLPPRAVSQALRSLVTNAQDASPPNTAVVITARLDDSQLSVIIRDRGPGISQDVMQRLGEPFFTTKAPGRGMGLGLFLARAVIEGVGGTLQIDSLEAGGTEVRARLPIDVGARSSVAGAQMVRTSESTPAQVLSKPA